MAVVLRPSHSLPTLPTLSLTQALQDFESGLSAAQKQQYSSNCVQPRPSSVLTFVAQIDSENNGRARRCFAPRLYSFLESTEQFARVVDTFVSSNPTIAALVWGGVKTAVLAASNVASYFDKVTSMIMAVGQRCPTLQKFGLLYPTSIDLQAALCEYYAIVVRFCAKVIEVSQRSNMLQTLSSVFQPFETEFRPFRDRFDEAATTIQLQITLASNQAAREDARQAEIERTKNASLRQSVLGFQKKSREEQAQAKEWRIAAVQRRASQMRSEIMANLTSINHTKPWKQATRQRLQGTAEWFERDPAFLNWRSAASSITLWCSGNLGTGKTVLAANVVAHLFTGRKLNDAIAFFFCRPDLEESCHARQILGSIVAQMLETKVKSLEDDALFQTYQESRNLDTMELVDFVLARLSPRFTYYMVLDGLDECESIEIDEIACGVNRFCTNGTIVFKLMIVGRPDLERQFFRKKRATHKMSLSYTNVDADIQQYIELTLEECLEDHRLKLVDPQLILEISPALKDGAHGMILWARLLIEELCSHNTDHEIRQALRDLPRNLSDLFNCKLRRLTAKPQAENAIKTLQLCGVAKRPMTKDEIREALTIRLGQTSLDFSSLPNDINQIIADCCGLAYVDEEDATVHYIHHSVHQHLFENKHSFLAPFDKKTLDKNLGLLCLTYVNFTNFMGQLVKTPKSSDVKIDPLKIGAIALAGVPETSNKFALKLLRSSRRSQTVTARDLKRKTEELLGVDESARLHSELKLRKFQFLAYAQKRWIFHLSDLTEVDNPELWQVFCKCVDGGVSIVDRPWETPESTAKPGHLSEYRSKSDVQWLAHNHHTALLWRKIVAKDSRLTSQELGEILLGCAGRGDIPMMDCLIDHTRLAMDHLGWALVAAAGHGSKTGVERLVAAGASLFDRLGNRTALQAAAGGGHLDVVETLLTAKANVNAPPVLYSGRTALQAAADSGHLDVVETLLTAKANVNAPPVLYSGRTALQAAADSGHLDVVERLLTAKADVNAAPGDGGGRTALQAAAQSGHLDVVERLLTAKADVNAPPALYNGGRTALQAAADSGHLDVVERLLTAKADVNAPPALYNGGRTALQAAADSGHLDVVERLLTAKADVNAAPALYNGGRTALQAAADSGHLDVVERLLTAKADVNAPPAENDGRTALQAAADSGHLDVVERLLTAKADVNAAPALYNGGRTALQAAAESGHLDVVERLLTAKANVNAPPAENDGRTALQAAADCGHLDVVERLLTAKADVNAPPAKYRARTALQAAEAGGYRVIVNRLKDAGAR